MQTPAKAPAARGKAATPTAKPATATPKPQGPRAQAQRDLKGKPLDAQRAQLKPKPQAPKEKPQAPKEKPQAPKEKPQASKEKPQVFGARPPVPHASAAPATAVAEAVPALQPAVAPEVQPGAAAATEAAAATTGGFQVNGQTFATLAEVHDWLEATRPPDPEIVIRVPPKAVLSQTAQTTWHYYNPNQKIVIDGQGGTVNGFVDGAPTIGYFLSYRPAVGAGTTAKRPAAANLEVKYLTVRGYESGGIEISPQTVPGKDDQWAGGLSAFVGGANIHDNVFRGLGSQHTPAEQAVWNQMRFGAGGVMMRGVQDSRVEHNTFKNLINGDVVGSRNGAKLIHAVYVNNASSGNTISGNDFENVSGDPVRLSNASNRNDVTGNRSRNAGDGALVSQWHSVANQDNPQLPSVGNRAHGNDIGKLYGKNRKARRMTTSVSNGQPAPLAV
jgi:hypothetical protein